MNKIVLMLAFCSCFSLGNAMAMESMSHDHAQHQGNMESGNMESMDHSSMNHGTSQDGGTFKHTVTVDGIRAEFQIMKLADMNMTDTEGRTHHVMVSFMKNDRKITNAVGKIKLISPSGKEQIVDLKDYGNGIFAASCTIDEQGKWGVICLFKDSDGKHVAKFWYNNQSK